MSALFQRPQSQPPFTGVRLKLRTLPPTSRICAAPDARSPRSAISSNRSCMLCLRRDAKIPQLLPPSLLLSRMRLPRSLLCSAHLSPRRPVNLPPPPTRPLHFLPFLPPSSLVMPRVIPSPRMAASHSRPRMPHWLPKLIKRSQTCASSLAIKSPLAAVIPPVVSFTCNGSRRSA